MNIGGVSIKQIMESLINSQASGPGVSSVAQTTVQERRSMPEVIIPAEKSAQMRAMSVEQNAPRSNNEISVPPVMTDFDLTGPKVDPRILAPADRDSSAGAPPIQWPDGGSGTVQEKYEAAPSVPAVNLTSPSQPDQMGMLQNELSQMQQQRSGGQDELETLRRTPGKDFDKKKDSRLLNMLKSALLVGGQAGPDASLEEMLGAMGAGAVGGAISPHMDERMIRDGVLVPRKQQEMAERDAQIKSRMNEMQQQGVIDNYDSLDEDRKAKAKNNADKIVSDSYDKAARNHTALVKAFLTPYNTSKSMDRSTPEGRSFFAKIKEMTGIDLPDRIGKFNYDTEFGEDGTAYIIRTNTSGEKVDVAPIMDPKDQTKPLRLVNKDQLRSETTKYVADSRAASDLTVAQLRAANDMAVANLRIDGSAKEQLEKWTTASITKLMTDPMYTLEADEAKKAKMVEDLRAQILRGYGK